MSAVERGDFSQIPILDVSTLYGGDEAAIRRHGRDVARLSRKRSASSMSSAIRFRAPMSKAVREAGKRFFELPEEQKLALKIDRNFRGYLPFAGSTIVTSSVATVSKPNQSESIFFMHEVDADRSQGAR